MAIIRKSLPDGKSSRYYVRYDTRVFLIKGLSDGAKVLYGYMASMKDGADFSDVFFMKGLDLSPSAYKRRKKELVDTGLILIDRIGLKQYILYIGFVGFGAKDVKANWLKEELFDRESLTVEHLQVELKMPQEKKDIDVRVDDEDDSDPFPDSYEVDLENY